MIIVSGKLYVEPKVRSSYLADCHELIEQARSSAGCLDFHLTADPIEADRINVYEQWETVAAVEAFRGSDPPSGQAAQIREAYVFQHEVTASHQL